MPHTDKPIPDSYRVNPSQLLTGEYPRNLDETSSRVKLRRLLEASVTLFLDLTEAGESGLAVPATGLVHLGNGRFYDPLLGRPLQPNPAGGPLTVPQALNRYAATAVGAPGVVAGAGR